MFIHNVFFWMKPATSAEVIDQLVLDCHSSLKKIPTVRQLWAGKPAMTPRDIADNSYGVGLTVVFDDADGHDAYQEHPIHMGFLDRQQSHWQHVQVYDFIA